MKGVNSLKAEEKEYLEMIASKLELTRLHGDSFYVLIDLKLMTLNLLGMISLLKIIKSF